MKTKPSSLKQQLSKDMKKQGHVGKKKPSNKKLSSEESLAEKPKKGNYREPNSKKLSSETSLQKSHKLVHLKEFAEFNEASEIDGNKWEGLPPEDKEKIDSMTHRDLAHLWRHGSSDNKLFHGITGEYMKDRLFNHFGGFNSGLSKSIGW